MTGRTRRHESSSPIPFTLTIRKQEISMTTEHDPSMTTDPELAPMDAVAGADYPPEITPGEERAIADAPKSLPEPIPNPEVNLDVPFIHQLWDTPDNFNGHWACGPTSTTMVLAHYGVLEPHPITVSAPAGHGHESQFGWYVSNPFTHGGRTFDASAGTPKNGRGQGIYGAVVGQYCGGGWCARASNIQAVLKHFLGHLGNADKFAFKSNEAPEIIKTVLRNRHPVIASGKLFGWDHLIVIRGFYEDAGATRWIVNDPYGYQTDKSFDGANVVYNWDEINLKWMVWMEGPHHGKR
jgi:hypothetical protein